ncbi:DNA (cytosine-5)-methyltransferase PliMCI [Colletotrichum spaethianum]|uniref:DNA (cytosine-5-)-methyltransferase n=1 Tax=Colletotrichum spaethianum TaxID=700344 RepID=A0AA37UIQ9_9PEZI|nr:DNA (cytosine-5)-methyltransferase PliMCI [Colletotrichum spaethianum]GKT48464.1 DNA (cytosine-5)-methyltransferase PliMCI [Colletotrichum spaethianum]
MDNLNDGLPFGWEDAEFLLATESDNWAGFQTDFSENWAADHDLSDDENRITRQVLQTPTTYIAEDSPTSESPELREVVQPEAPLYEQAAWDEDGVEVGTILPAAPINSVNRISVDIPTSTLVVPRYLYQGEEPPAELAREWAAVQSLLEEHRRVHNEDDGDYIEFDLDQFAVYINATTPEGKRYEEQPHPSEMRPLQHLGVRSNCYRMFVDGILSVGDKRFFIRGVPFEQLPIGTYGLSESTVGSEIWIRSRLNVTVASGQGPDIYYRLKNPSTEYRRYYTGFLWVADLTKHVVDYLSAALDKKRRVVFRDFRSDFNGWLMKKHGDSEAFSLWRKQYRRTDFCSAVVANLEFIYKEASGVLGYNKVGSIYLWKEIREFTAYLDGEKKDLSAPTSGISTPLASPSSTPSKQKPAHIPKTVVTPYVDQLFNHLPCGSMMEALSPSSKTERLRRDVISVNRLEPSLNVHTSAKNLVGKPTLTSIKVGDVISITRDGDNSNWAREVAAGFDDVDRWFGLVQKVHRRDNDEKSFDIIWIYRPVDTICGNMRYPWNNELFVSDHCSCNDSAHAKIKEEEVLAVHRVDWGGSSTTDAEFFCRQTYLHEERRFITFHRTHLFCMHSQAKEQKFAYKIGDTLLVRLKNLDNVVEPCELVEFCDSEFALFRLLRRRHHLNNANEQVLPNELVYSDELLTLRVKNIHGKCLVRIFRPDETIPAPYDRKGVGNVFFIRYRWQSGQLVAFEDGFSSLRQGFNPAKSFRKLRGVDLFCGGGNFGRGLEEGGAIEMSWANDINVRAIHTYMANTTNTVRPFAGSIDDMQRLALQGKFSDKVPPIGSVDFVSGGSPCPGFSVLTVDKTAPEQRKNQSLVAAFASFIDIYRPKFGLLENVMEIVQSKTRRNEDVFCQLICAIVGLGYQAHFFLLDAWTYGSPQSRSRVFLCFAAPGFKLPEIPIQSHSHYMPVTRSRNLGWLPNGESMVKRLVMPTPFKFVSVAEATADLPDIMDGKADCCVNFPDHRTVSSVTRSMRAQLGVIPMHPYGMNFCTTWNDGKGIMTAAERDFFPKRGSRVISGSRSWGRAIPHNVMPTVTTTPSPTDTRIGRIMHWSQNRVFSVMEVRRAQGFLDHEVLLGQPRDQWKMVGNSVSREVSLALGLSFREAWLGSLIDGEEVEPAIRVPLQSSQTVAGDINDDSEGTVEAETPPSASSGKRASDSYSPRPQKRKMKSSFVIELVVSRIKKTQQTQMAPGTGESLEDNEPPEATSASNSSSSSIEIIELD